MHRIELIRQPAGKRHRIGSDGKDSANSPEATASPMAECIRRWLVSKS